jgi:transcriptional regulator with XRE-family HTH domain
LRELRNIRLRRGLSQADLSAKTGVAEYTISEIEAGKRTPRPSTLRKLAQGLGVEVADLYGEADNPLAQAPPSAEQRSFNNHLLEERRADWDVALRSARQLQEHGRTRLEGLLSAWGESKERGEDPAERRPYLDEIRELLQEAYDARPTLFEATSWERLADQWPEVQEADEFYRDLWRLVESAGLSIRTGNAQEERPKAVEESEAA